MSAKEPDYEKVREDTEALGDVYGRALAVVKGRFTISPALCLIRFPL